MIQLLPYHISHQPGIDDMMQEIKAEYSLPIAHPGYKPNLPDAYWVVVDGEKVIGTVGVNNQQHYAVLKRMMLRKAYRGKDAGVSGLLFDTAVSWSLSHNLPIMYLGTIHQFTAAQQFYRKRGFTEIPASALPLDFPNNPIDNVFFKLNLHTTL